MEKEKLAKQGQMIFPTKKQPRRFPIAFGSRLFHEGQFAVANAIRRDAIEEDDVIIGEIDRDLFAHRVVNNAEDDRSEDRFIDLDLEGRLHAGRKGGDDFGLSSFAGATDDELRTDAENDLFIDLAKIEVVVRFEFHQGLAEFDLGLVSFAAYDLASKEVHGRVADEVRDEDVVWRGSWPPTGRG